MRGGLIPTQQFPVLLGEEGVNYDTKRSYLLDAVYFASNRKTYSKLAEYVEEARL